MKTSDLQVPLSVTKGVMSAGPNGIELIILMYSNPYMYHSCKGNTIKEELNSLTVLTTHFVINLVNDTYSKLVEIWPMTVSRYGIELYIDSVFLVGIRLVFLGILPTDTKGKLGWYILVLKKWREPNYT